MSGFAFQLALTAALLHAFWNALVKSADERTLVIAAISAMHGVVGSVLLFFFDAPATESWPYIIASTLIHYAYYAFLLVAYRLGDLSQVYPISRGMAPLLVALGALVLADEILSYWLWCGVIAVSVGISALAFGARAQTSAGAVTAAVATGLMIAGYSVADGIGVRLSDSPLGYTGWLFVLETPVIGFVLLRRRSGWDRGTSRTIGLGMIAGLFATTAYGLVIYAKTLAPLAAVSAVRESSVIIAALIGVVLFGERPWQLRIVCALLVGAGVIVLSRTH